MESVRSPKPRSPALNEEENLRQFVLLAALGCIAQ